MRTVTLCLCVLALVVSAAFLPQGLALIMANSPKVGKVIDNDTHSGVPNAVVIAAAFYASRSLIHGSTYERIYQLTTTTDADGEFRLPSTWQFTRLGVPGITTPVVWIVTVFKPGYAVLGDDKSWEIDDRGEANFPPRSAVESPSAKWRGFAIEVDPIKLIKTNLTFKEAAIYYHKIAATDLGTRGSAELETIALVRRGFEALVPRLCELPADTVLDTTTTNAVLSFAEDYRATQRKLPSATSAAGYTSIHQTYTAEEICEAMRAGAPQ